MEKRIRGAAGDWVAGWVDCRNIQRRAFQMRRAFGAVPTLIIAAFIGGVAVAIGYQVADFFKNPPMEIVSTQAIKNSAQPGGFIIVESAYIKREDCSGNWSIRAEFADGEVRVLASGGLGLHNPGAYNIKIRVAIPPDAPIGGGRLREVDTVICGDKASVARGPWVAFEVLQ